MNIKSSTYEWVTAGGLHSVKDAIRWIESGDDLQHEITLSINNGWFGESVSADDVLYELKNDCLERLKEELAEQ